MNGEEMIIITIIVCFQISIFFAVIVVSNYYRIYRFKKLSINKISLDDMQEEINRRRSNTIDMLCKNDKDSDKRKKLQSNISKALHHGIKDFDRND